MCQYTRLFCSFNATKVLKLPCAQHSATMDKSNLSCPFLLAGNTHLCFQPLHLPSNEAKEPPATFLSLINAKNLKSIFVLSNQLKSDDTSFFLIKWHKNTWERKMMPFNNCFFSTACQTGAVSLIRSIPSWYNAQESTPGVFKSLAEQQKFSITQSRSRSGTNNEIVQNTILLHTQGKFLQKKRTNFVEQACFSKEFEQFLLSLCSWKTWREQKTAWKKLPVLQVGFSCLVERRGHQKKEMGKISAASY